MPDMPPVLAGAPVVLGTLLGVTLEDPTGLLGTTATEPTPEVIGSALALVGGFVEGGVLAIDADGFGVTALILAGAEAEGCWVTKGWLLVCVTPGVTPVVGWVGVKLWSGSEQAPAAAAVAPARKGRRKEFRTVMALTLTPNVRLGLRILRASR
jgi:hypothetical protein